MPVTIPRTLGLPKRVHSMPIHASEPAAAEIWVTSIAMPAAPPDVSALPQNNDVYQIKYRRPFWISDTLTFNIQSEAGLNKQELTATMDDIKVVPNPYVATNEMEEAVANPFLNQRRKIMFTHLPAQCTIKIFTSSGILVDHIDVNNQADDGIVHWDLLTKEGLEIAAGVYIYYVKSIRTGDEKLGKFAVVK